MSGPHRTRPCKKRKDGAPSADTAQTRIHGQGPTHPPRDCQLDGRRRSILATMFSMISSTDGLIQLTSSRWYCASCLCDSAESLADVEKIAETEHMLLERFVEDTCAKNQGDGGTGPTMTFCPNPLNIPIICIECASRALFDRVWPDERLYK